MTVADSTLGEEDVELLNPARIAAHLEGLHTGSCDIEVVRETESTHQDLLDRPAAEAHRVARLAERQTGGRGRRGRRWFSPFARNLYLSLAWRFEAPAATLSFLPLVLPVAVARAVTGMGFRGHGIKWPNDLVTSRGKLGGCLVEGRGLHDGSFLAVLGVGLNIRLAGAPGLERLDQPWDDLARELPDVRRNDVAGEVLCALLEAVHRFEADGPGAEGFDSFRQDWDRYDRLAGRELTVRGEHAMLEGRCLGLGESGGLRVEVDGRAIEVHAGEVSVRTRSSWPDV